MFREKSHPFRANCITRNWIVVLTKKKDPFFSVYTIFQRWKDFSESIGSFHCFIFTKMTFKLRLNWMSPVKFPMTMDNGVFLCVFVRCLSTSRWLGFFCTTCYFYYNGIHYGECGIAVELFMIHSVKIEYPLGF